jgi:hypothetical protein
LGHCTRYIVNILLSVVKCTLKWFQDLLSCSKYSAKRLWENVCYNMTIITVIGSVRHAWFNMKVHQLRHLGPTATAKNQVNHTTVT